MPSPVFELYVPVGDLEFRVSVTSSFGAIILSSISANTEDCPWQVFVIWLCADSADIMALHPFEFLRVSFSGNFNHSFIRDCFIGG